MLYSKEGYRTATVTSVNPYNENDIFIKLSSLECLSPDVKVRRIKILKKDDGKYELMSHPGGLTRRIEEFQLKVSKLPADYHVETSADDLSRIMKNGLNKAKASLKEKGIHVPVDMFHNYGSNSE